MANVRSEEIPRRKTSSRGFASMDAAKQREIARKGGRSVPAEKRSFSRSPELAAAAGRKGGNTVPRERRSFSQDRALAAEAGRKGGIGSRKTKDSAETDDHRSESFRALQAPAPADL
jgi:general stress protein YciG